MFMVLQNYFTYFELSQSLGWAKSKDHYGKKKHQITSTFHIYIQEQYSRPFLPQTSHKDFENLELNSHLPEKVGALLCNLRETLQKLGVRGHKLGSTKLQVKSYWKLCPSVYVKSVDIHSV